MISLFEAPDTVVAVPSAKRSRGAQRLTAAIALGQLELQVCAVCGTVQYPPRETCRRCLSDALEWRPETGEGELLAGTALHFSHDPYFRARTPWRVGLVRLDSGPSVVVHLAADCPKPPVRVVVKGRLDRGSSGVLLASAKGDGADSMSDPRLREMCSDPRDAQVLVTDGRSPHAQALVRAFAAAGASRIWVGLPGSTDRSCVPEGIRELSQVTGLRMDVTDADCIQAAAASVAGEVDILVNTADAIRAARADRPTASGSHGGWDEARLEMDVHYFGLLNLVRHFGRALSERARRVGTLAPAWVNILSVSAFSDRHADCGTRGASMAAARSLSESLRGQLRESGVRLVNVYPGPLDEAHSQGDPVPKLSASTFANAIVAALRAGVEEVFPGEVAQEWLEANQGRARIRPRVNEVKRP